MCTIEATYSDCTNTAEISFFLGALGGWRLKSFTDKKDTETTNGQNRSFCFVFLLNRVNCRISSYSNCFRIFIWNTCHHWCMVTEKEAFKKKSWYVLSKIENFGNIFKNIFPLQFVACFFLTKMTIFISKTVAKRSASCCGRPLRTTYTQKSTNMYAQ